jgi:hypothetical protein
VRPVALPPRTRPGTGSRFARVRWAGLLCVVSALALGTLGAAPAARAGPACWRTVIDEWAAGHLRGDHSVSCYRKAIGKAPSDLKLYSTFGDDVQRTIQSRILALDGQPVRRLSSASVAPPVQNASGWSPSKSVTLAVVVVLTAGAGTTTGLAVRRRKRRLSGPPG